MNVNCLGRYRGSNGKNCSRGRNSTCKGPEAGSGLTGSWYDWDTESKGETGVRTEVGSGQILQGFTDHGKDVAL